MFQPFKISTMKQKLLYLTLFFSLTFLGQSVQTPIKLVGCRSASGTNSITQWTVGSLVATSQTPISVSGFLIGTSTFDASSGTYYVKVALPNIPTTSTNQVQFSVPNNAVTVSSSTTMPSNSGLEVDMQTGLVYSFERSGTQFFMNRYNPVTNVNTNLGTLALAASANFFPDSSCYDTNNKKYYFLQSDSTNMLKLVTVNVVANPIVVTISPLTLPANLVGNIGLEFNNTTNEIIASYGISGAAGTQPAVTIGKINTTTNTLQTVTTIPGIQSFVLGARTFDQNTQSLLFRSSYSPNNTSINSLLVKYNTLTNTSEFINMPFSLIEFEADNYQFAFTRFGSVLNNQSFQKETVDIYPNPTNDIVNFSQSVSNIKITDLTGKVVYQDSKSLVDNVSVLGLTSGVYILNYDFENNQYSKKIVKN